MNWKSVSKVFGFLLLVFSACMVLPLFWALYYGTSDWAAFALSIPILGLPGLFLYKTSPDFEFGLKEAYFIVSGGWILSSLVCALPFVLSGFIADPASAVFEAMSGLTTTGATAMVEVEVPAAGVLFWRSFLHWLGGMGIIVIFLAVLPKTRLGGSALFKAEVPGPEVERLTPRLKKTASSLWAIYAFLTVLETVLLRFAGMSFYDSLIHTFGTVATGGLSNKNLSVGAYANPWIRYIILLFMILAGMNFGLFYRVLATRRIGSLLKDKELQAYLAIILVATVVITVNLSGSLGVFGALDHGSFQVVSVMTTTGYSSVNFDLWPDLSRALLLLLMFVGASSGSTAGSVKVIRYVILSKGISREVRRMIHTKAVLPVRVGEHVVPEDTVRSVLVFFAAYLACAVIGTLIMLGFGLDILSAFSSVAATLGNIGPGLNLVGPARTFAQIPALGKVVLSFLMLLGRLEIFTVLVIFAPSFWR